MSQLVLCTCRPGTQQCHTPSNLQGATVHVKVINAVTLQDQAFAGARGVLPFTVNATAYPYVVPAGGANLWSAIIRNANNQVGTAGSPIPHVGSWRFQIAVVSPYACSFFCGG